MYINNLNDKEKYDEGKNNDVEDMGETSVGKSEKMTIYNGCVEDEERE